MLLLGCWYVEAVGSWSRQFPRWFCRGLFNHFSYLHMGVFTAIPIVVYDLVKLFFGVVAFDGPVIPFAVLVSFGDPVPTGYIVSVGGCDRVWDCVWGRCGGGVSRCCTLLLSGHGPWGVTLFFYQSDKSTMCTY